jgi:hypothetical protein
MKTNYVCSEKQNNAISAIFIITLVILVAGAITLMNAIA